MMALYTVKFEIPSKISAFLVYRLPKVRGYSILGSFLFKLLPLNRLAIMQVQDRCFALDLSYRSQLAIVARKGTENAETEFVLDHLRTGDTFFDLGSNWGYYTALASTLVGENGRVVSVEANLEPFTRIIRLIHTGRLTNVLPFNFALSDLSGEQMSIVKPWYRNDTGGYVSTSKGKVTTEILTSTRTIDQLWYQVGAPSVRMAKLDVEGFEPLVLLGGKSFFTKAVSHYALVEVSEWTLARCGKHHSTLYENFSRYGFPNKYAFGLRGELEEIKPNELGRYEFVGNVLFSRERL